MPKRFMRLLRESFALASSRCSRCISFFRSPCSALTHRHNNFKTPPAHLNALYKMVMRTYTRRSFSCLARAAAPLNCSRLCCAVRRWASKSLTLFVSCCMRSTRATRACSTASLSLLHTRHTEALLVSHPQKSMLRRVIKSSAFATMSNKLLQ